MYKGIIFDLDGTLIDSMPIWQDLSYDYLVAQGVEPRPDLRDKVSTMYLDESSRYVVEEYGLSVEPAEVTAYINGMVDDFYIERVPPKADAGSFLRLMKDAGVRMCVATATERRLCEPALRRNGMLGYFDKIFTCAEVGSSKVSGEIFELAFAHLGTKREETLVIEDSLHAVETAHRHGFPVASIYDEAQKKNAALMKELSVRYFREYSEITSLWDQN